RGRLFPEPFRGGTPLAAAASSCHWADHPLCGSASSRPSGGVQPTPPSASTQAVTAAPRPGSTSSHGSRGSKVAYRSPVCSATPRTTKGQDKRRPSASGQAALRQSPAQHCRTVGSHPAHPPAGCPWRFHLATPALTDLLRREFSAIFLNAQLA